MFQTTKRDWRGRTYLGLGWLGGGCGWCARNRDGGGWFCGGFYDLYSYNSMIKGLKIIPQTVDESWATAYSTAATTASTTDTKLWLGAAALERTSSLESVTRCWFGVRRSIVVWKVENWKLSGIEKKMMWVDLHTWLPWLEAVMISRCSFSIAESFDSTSFRSDCEKLLQLEDS